MDDLVSIVITTYKRPPEMLKRSLESAINQSYHNIEIIIVDDSPSDYPERELVGKMIESYSLKDNKITYIKHKQNLGACAARNTGLRNAKGVFINFLDDDDELVNNKIEKQLNILVNNQELAYVYCKCFVFYENTGKKYIERKHMHSGMIYEKLLVENFVGTTSFPLIRKEHLIEEGGFDTLLPACQDYDMWIRLSKNHPVSYIDEPLVVYHYHDGDQISKNPQKRIIGMLRVISKNSEYLNKHRDIWALNQRKLILEYARNGEQSIAFFLLLKCILKDPKGVKGNLKSIKTIIQSFWKN